MLEYIKKIRENLKNPKKKAITKLALYLIFFIIVFLLITNAPSNNRKNINVKQEIITYDYIYDINQNDIINHIVGKSNDENDFYSYDKIKKLINKSEMMEKTIYKDKSIKYIYNIKANDYYDNCIERCDSIIVITVYENGFINNVIINLSNITNNTYSIDIKYENIESK